jgi:hypothetical protein
LLFIGKIRIVSSAESLSFTFWIFHAGFCNARNSSGSLSGCWGLIFSLSAAWVLRLPFYLPSLFSWSICSHVISIWLILLDIIHIPEILCTVMFSFALLKLHVFNWLLAIVLLVPMIYGSTELIVEIIIHKETKRDQISGWWQRQLRKPCSLNCYHVFVQESMLLLLVLDWMVRKCLSVVWQLIFSGQM